MNDTNINRALIVSLSEYQDSNFRQTLKNNNSIDELSKLLEQTSIFHSNLKTLKEPNLASIYQEIQKQNEFFSKVDDKHRDISNNADTPSSIFLIYLTGHCILTDKNDNSQKKDSLYFVTQDTKLEDIENTSLTNSAITRFIKDIQKAVPNTIIVLVFDCLFSRLVTKNQDLAKVSKKVDIQSRFDDCNKIILLTCSKDIQFFLNKEEKRFTKILDKETPLLGVFTSLLTKGLKDKIADINNDGNVSLLESYGFVVNSLKTENISLEPDICFLGVENDVILCPDRITTNTTTNASQHQNIEKSTKEIQKEYPSVFSKVNIPLKEKNDQIDKQVQQDFKSLETKDKDSSENNIIQEPFKNEKKLLSPKHDNNQSIKIKNDSLIDKKIESHRSPLGSISSKNYNAKISDNTNKEHIKKEINPIYSNKNITKSKSTPKYYYFIPIPIVLVIIIGVVMVMNSGQTNLPKDLELSENNLNKDNIQSFNLPSNLLLISQKSSSSTSEKLLIILDTQNNRIQVFQEEAPFEYIFVNEWGGIGSGDGKLDFPRGVAYDPENELLFVADTENNRIQVFTKDGNFVDKWGSGGYGNGEFSWPRGLTYDPEDELLFVADSKNNRIQVFTKDGNFVDKWGSGGSGNGEFSWPSSLTYDPEDELLFVADSSNDRIQVFTKDGDFEDKWGSEGSGNGEFNKPKGIMYDHEDELLFVADSENNRIQVFTKDGDFVDKWGSEGSGNGEFSWPRGLTYDYEDELLFVADSKNDRIQAFDNQRNYKFEISSQ